MRVYACKFDLQLGASMQSVLEVIAAWISRKARPSHFPSDYLRKTGNYKLLHLDVAVTTIEQGYPMQTSIRVTHGDNAVSGRQWATEIGMWHDSPESNLQCSVLLETQEISTRVSEAVEVTRPIIVHQLIERFGHPARCPGKRGVLQLTAAEASDFCHFLEDPDRQHPVILLSARPADGQYFVSPDDLNFQTVGLADVYAIGSGENTYAITTALGRRHSSWNGAINIIFPVSKRYGEPTLPTYLLLPDQIESMQFEGRQMEREVLSLICHHTNYPNSKAHLSPEKVYSAQLQRRVEYARQEAAATGDLEGMVALLEEMNATVERKAARLEEENETLQLNCSYHEDEIRRLKFDMANIQSSFGELQMTTGQGKRLSADTLQIIREAIQEKPSPEQSLTLIEAFFPERVLVLDSAHSSARLSAGFRYPEKVFDLLWLLVTNYWEELASGGSDATARQCFGSTYAAKESETVEKNEAARNRRTFYLPNKQPVTMFKHLKHGVKDNVADTIRVHFEWIPDLNKIVIGHCGPHLDFD